MPAAPRLCAPLGRRGSSVLAVVMTLGLAACREATPTPDAATAATAAVEAATTALETPAESTADKTPSGGTDAAMDRVTPGPTLASVAQASAQAKARQPVFVSSFGEPGIAPGQLTLPFDVAVAPDGSLYVSDSTGVQRFRPDGSFISRLGGSDLAIARGVGVGSDGRVYVTGLGAEVRVYDDAGEQLANLGSTGTGPGQFTQPVDAHVAPEGTVYIVDRGNRTVQKFAAGGEYLGAVGAAGGGRGQFTVPWSVVVGPNGDVFISSADDYLIQRYAPDGTFLDTFGRSHTSDVVWQTAGLSFDSQGYLYALQVPTQAVQSYDVETDPPNLRWEFGGLGSGPGQFTSPSGMTVVGQTLFVADTSNHRIQQFELP